MNPATDARLAQRAGRILAHFQDVEVASQAAPYPRFGPFRLDIRRSDSIHKIDVAQRMVRVPLDICIRPSAAEASDAEGVCMDDMAAQARIDIRDAARPKGRPTLLGVALGLGVVVMALMATFHAAKWYAENVLLRRYCGEVEASLTLVDRVLTDRRPAGAEATRLYVVAAKLLYLVPQQRDEPVPAYLARLRSKLEANCR